MKYKDLKSELFSNVELSEDESAFIDKMLKSTDCVVFLSLIKKTKVHKGGRKSIVSHAQVKKLKDQGKTQEQIAQLLQVSLSTIRRHWK